MYSIYCLYTFFFYFYWRYLLLSFYNMINVACHEKHLEKVAIEVLLSWEYCRNWDTYIVYFHASNHFLRADSRRVCEVG